MDHAPPPFFKRGPAPLVRLSFYLACAIALLVLDLRFHAVGTLRQGISLVIDPLQRTAQAPLRMLSEGTDYFASLETLQQENQKLKATQLQLAPDLLRLPQLEAENQHLRQLLNLQQRESASGQAANILYTARDPFSHQIFLDKGEQHGVATGQPVIDNAGIVGQVTQVFPFSSEVTLITDKNQAIPVLVLRTGQRSITFGTGDGNLELKYIPANADIEKGDVLVTSGLDGTYPPGFPVAEVILVERDKAYAFAHIVGAPLAAPGNHTTVVVLNRREAGSATTASPSTLPADKAPPGS